MLCGISVLPPACRHVPACRRASVAGNKGATLFRPAAGRGRVSREGIILGSGSGTRCACHAAPPAGRCSTISRGDAGSTVRLHVRERLDPDLLCVRRTHTGSKGLKVSE